MMRVSLPFPAPLRQLDLHKLVLRAMLLWLLVRLLVMAVVLSPPAGGLARTLGATIVSRDLWYVSPTTALILIVVTTLMSHIDSRFMREPIFYANIGRPTWSAAVAGAATATFFELMFLFVA